MSTRWRVIDLVDFSGDIEVRRGRLVIGGSEEPLSDVACILTGSVTKWSGSIVALAAKYDVPILSCDWKGVPIAALSSWSDNTRIGARHQAQASLTIPRQKNAWMRIVRAKIRGQAQNLSAGSEKRDKLERLAGEVRSGDPKNVEASAARTYWSGLFDGEPFSRDKDGTGRNILLNYGYAVMRGSVIRAISIAGLAPALGLWHRNRSNAFALADDLIEPFRPAVDWIVKSLPADALVADRATKVTLVGVLSQPIGKTGETVMTSITQLAQRYANYVEGEVDSLDVPLWDTIDG